MYLVKESKITEKLDIANNGCNVGVIPTNKPPKIIYNNFFWLNDISNRTKPIIKKSKPSGSGRKMIQFWEKGKTPKKHRYIIEGT